MWPCVEKVVASSIGDGRIAIESAPASEFIEGQRVSCMHGDDSADLPIPNHGVESGVHVFAKLFTAAHWELVSNIAGKDVLLAEVARSPVRTGVIRVLPAGPAT